MIDGWVIDFVRALSDRPWVAKVLLRFVFGKYAYREFYGLIEAMKEKGYPLDSGYYLEEQKYHEDKVRIGWWKDLN